MQGLYYVNENLIQWNLHGFNIAAGLDLTLDSYSIWETLNIKQKILKKRW